MKKCPRCQQNANVILMNLRYSIILVFFVSLQNIQGQKLEIIQTKDLLKISKQYGLDSAIIKSGDTPLHQLDIKTANLLVREASLNKGSYRINEFLFMYSLYAKDSDIGRILYDYFIKKRNIEKNTVIGYNGKTLKLNRQAIHAMARNPVLETEKYFIDTYKYWAGKSTKYFKKYSNCNDSVRRLELLNDYNECNSNCFDLQYGLYYLKSKFYDKNKFDSIRNLLPRTWRYSLYEPPDGYVYYEDTTKSEIIHLQGNYDNIGHIDFDNEVSLKKYFRNNTDSKCWSKIVYNELIGYYDVGCYWDQSAGYKIILIDRRTLKIILVRNVMS
jgi:hypothetical protein